MDNLLRLELEDMEEITVENQEEQKERFKIEDLHQANWAFRKLAALNQKEKEIDQLARAEKSRIEDWEKREKESLKHSSNFFNYLLEEFYREQRTIDPKYKLTTPYGKVTSRKQQPQYTYNDDLIIESLKEKGLKRLVDEKVVVTVNKNDLKKEIEVLENVVSLNGEIVEDVVQNGILFTNIETGELYDAEDYIYHDRVITIGGKIIHGVEVEDREDSVTIKAVE